ncbi:Crp/Fnr family transcriptional regulator [soil metagenome]
MSNNLSNLKYWYLEKFDFTQKLCKSERLHMEKSMVMKKVDKNTMLHFPEMKERYVYFLKEGMVKIVHYNEDGRETIKYLLSPGNIFGELALLENDEDSNDYAIAVDNCVICFMDVESMNKMMLENNELNISIRKLIGLRLKRLETRLESLIFKDAQTRIVEFLYELFREFGKKEGQVVKIKNFLTHDEIAKLTASSRQTVTSVLNSLRNKGIISYSSKYIELKEPSI